MQSIITLIEPSASVRLGSRIGPEGEQMNERCIDAETTVYGVVIAAAVVAVLATGAYKTIAIREEGGCKRRQMKMTMLTVGGGVAVGALGYGLCQLIRSIRRRQWRSELESVRSSLMYPSTTDAINNRLAADMAESSVWQTNVDFLRRR